jgi:methylmalonyl-CoA mutase cobalamin-binding subunit
MTPDREPTEALLEIAGAGSPRPAIALGLGLLAEGRSLEQVIVDVLAPVQREVGLRWETNRWGTADEHAATAVVDGVLGALSLEAAVPTRPRGQVVVACAEGEHHTLPARMGAEILRADGWDVLFAGGSMPADDLQRYAAEREPDAVLVSCTVPLFLPGARRCFTAIAKIGLPAFGVGAAFGPDERRARRLGALGWLGPGVDLGDLLHEAALEELHPWPTPPEALALGLDRRSLTDACHTALDQRLPGLVSCAEEHLRSTGVDVDYVLGYLTAAVDLADAVIFEEFVAWLTGVVRARGGDLAVLGWSLQIIGDVLGAAGMAEASALCAAAGSPTTAS